MFSRPVQSWTSSTSASAFVLAIFALATFSCAAFVFALALCLCLCCCCLCRIPGISLRISSPISVAATWATLLSPPVFRSIIASGASILPAKLSFVGKGCLCASIGLGTDIFANARSVRNALDRARLRQASRLFASPDRELTREDLSTILPADIRASRVFGQPSPQPSPADAGERAEDGG